MTMDNRRLTIVHDLWSIVQMSGRECTDKNEVNNVLGLEKLKTIKLLENEDGSPLSNLLLLRHPTIL